MKGKNNISSLNAQNLGIITIFLNSDVFKIKSSIAYLLYTLTPSMPLGFSCRSMISFYNQHLYATKLTLFLFSGVSHETTHPYDTQLLMYIIPCSDDLADFSLTDTDESSIPMDIDQLRERAMKKIARKEAAGLLNQPLFVQDKRGKPKARTRSPSPTKPTVTINS